MYWTEEWMLYVSSYTSPSNSVTPRISYDQEMDIAYLRYIVHGTVSTIRLSLIILCGQCGQRSVL